MKGELIQLNETETAVLNYLPIGGKQPIALSRLIFESQRSNRSVRRALETLKEKGVPIVADFRHSLGAKGYFIATSEEERNLIGSYEKMGRSILKQAALIREADLVNWADKLQWEREEIEANDPHDFS